MPRRTTLEEIRRYLSADSVAYLSLDGLKGAVRGGHSKYCTSCYTGVYPVAFPRDEAAYLQLALKLNPSRSAASPNPFRSQTSRRIRHRLMDYKASGVDIDAGNETVRRIRGLARSTFTGRAVGYRIVRRAVSASTPGDIADPVLVSSADGVGTKLKVAFLADRHDTVGVDLVNHCVNDILVQGAEPLFFLDYLATGRLSPERGRVDRRRHGAPAARTAARCSAARRRRCRASTPTANTTSPGSSSASSIVNADQRRAIAAGDVLIGVPSSGLHTNGYSLASASSSSCLGLEVDSHVAELGPPSARRCWSRIVSICVVQPLAQASAHQGDGAHHRRRHHRQPAAHPAARHRRVVRVSSWEVPPLFRWLQESGRVPIDDMMRTFNMGIGLIIVTTRSTRRRSSMKLAALGGKTPVIGEIVAGEPRR